MRQAPRVRCLAPRVRPTTRCTSVRLPPVPLRRTLAVWSRSPSDIIPPKAARQTPPPTPPSTLNALGSLSASLIGQSSEEEAATFRESWHSVVRQTAEKDAVAALDLLHKWRQSDPSKVSVSSHAMVLSSIAREGKTLHLLPLLTLMREQGPKPNVVVYNIILDGLRRAGQYSRMPAIYEMMQADRIEPTAATYTVMGRCWVHDKKFDTLIEVMNKPGWYPDLKFFESILRAMSELNTPREVVLSTLGELKARNLPVSEAATRAVLAALVDRAQTVEELRGCLTVRLDSLLVLIIQQLDRLGLRLTADSFTFIAKRWSIISPATAEQEVKAAMAQRGLQMDHRHQTILAAGEVRIGRGTNAVQRLQTLQADGRGLDAQMLTTLLGAHLAENKVEEALALFAKMQAGELAQPTEVTYTVMIGELSNRRMPEKAAMLLKEMHHAQVPILPHKLDILYTIIIRAFAAAKDSQSMLRMIRDLYSVHHAEPSATIWVTLFRALTQLHQGARAIPFITNLRRSSGPQRPIALWNAAMHLYAATMSQRTLKEAEDLMRDLIERGPKPDQTTWECLVSGCAALAQFSRAKYWLEQCQLPEGTVMLLSDFSSAGRVEG